ncbi:hypothetical protein Micbo1qcDRAFT_109620, partial [Microdochium bolleyi]
QCTVDEVERLFEVFQEEVETVYPVVDSQRLASHAGSILEYIRGRDGSRQPCGRTVHAGLTDKDLEIAKVALATAMVIEAPQATARTASLIESVESHSLYYFHCNEDLLAWRTIGHAARAALEMGLHRKTTVSTMFREQEQQQEATRVFWCIYVLDRRWSFGTSLPFTLGDRDIDPELAEPDSQHDYLRCSIRYGRLCSNLWDALFSHGQAHGNSISNETAEALNAQTQAWFDSIPPRLRLRNPQSDLTPASSTSYSSTSPSHPDQPQALLRLRALLYLRANHTRLLIYRQHLTSPARVRTSSGRADLAVTIARDTVDLLARLHAGSDIYARQQNGFNYFLVAAVAAIFLAVCHAPDAFAEPCRDSFGAAVALVRDLSRFSRASRRLWRSVRGLLPRLRRL